MVGVRWRWPAFRTHPAGVALALLVLSFSCGAPPRVVGKPMLSSKHGELFLRTETGEEMRSRALVGSTLELDGYRARLDGVFNDGGIVFHHFLIVDEAGKPSDEFCTPDHQGHRWALAVQNKRGNVELVCSSGAVGKCVRFGYPPPENDTPNSGLAERLHEACVRMFRADYGGDGKSGTRDGTMIRICDLYGIHPCSADMPIEAAWSTDGAVCVAKARVPEVISTQQLVERYPRLVGHVGPSCTLAEGKKSNGILMFSGFP
jgi:hypothetical protein